MTTLYSATPIQIGGVTLPNRYVMGSMHTGLESKPEHFDELARYYAERAKGGAGLIVTGGFAPNYAGRMKDDPCTFDSEDQIDAHRKITSAVHKENGKIILQILHAGRYGYHSAIVAPSAIRSPINRDEPRALDEQEILQTIEDYAKTTELAIKAGYDGVEIMASEGYLISQFLANRTNHREDSWGGRLSNRAKLALEIVKRVRHTLGEAPILSYRISAIELVEGGLEEEDIIWLATQLEKHGVNCLATGIGWHEATVPTIAAVVPHAAFADVITKVKAAVTIPVTASNRINLPSTAEKLLASGQADLISMARPFLADPYFVKKALTQQSEKISVCIGCNQACLDHYFTNETISCLVNPRVMRENHFTDSIVTTPKKIAVVGGGVAGLAAALEAAKRGHHVTIFEAEKQLGGQFTLAANVPGKSDYALFLQGYIEQLRSEGVIFALGKKVSADNLIGSAFDEVIIASGIRSRQLDIPGIDDPRVVSYTDILSGNIEAGKNVLIIGAGGIGHDVALYVSSPQHKNHSEQSTLAAFRKHWGIGQARAPENSLRNVTMLKRSTGSFGKSLGKTTGWILRQELKDFNVQQIAGVTYKKIDEEGLHIDTDQQSTILPADTIIVCAGQESENSLTKPLADAGISVHVIGGANVAEELDAKRAIAEGATLGNKL